MPIKIEGFKPNLIPNNPKDGSFSIEDAIRKNGNPIDYYITLKKDGCRLQAGISDTILTRSLKKTGSKLVLERFQKLNDLCIKLKITLDGEFYMRDLKFNAIFRFFSKSDVTSEKYKNDLEKEYNKNSAKFLKKYDNLGIPFLTNFHNDLKFFAFDGQVLDRPDLVGYGERIEEIQNRLSLYDIKHFEFPEFFAFKHYYEIENFFKESLENGYEGLVLTHKDHEYKYGRNSIKQGTILKMKDDSIEYDGVIIDVLEGTKIKEGVARGIDNFGNSTTSGKKDDREPNGKAKCFVVEFENHGTFNVALRTFDDEDKINLLKNKEDYIGRHFKYTAMTPVKDFPRHAYFDCWRDDK